MSGLTAAMKRVWAFLLDRFNALSALLVLLLGAGLVYHHQKKRVRKVEDLLAIEKAQNEMIKLRTEREALARDASVSRGELALLDHEILKRKRRIVEIHEDHQQPMSTAEITEAFARLGYALFVIWQLHEALPMVWAG